MGNFMSTPKSSENQISSQSRPLPSRTDAAHLSSAVRSSNRVDTCKAIHCNKRRIADGHNLKHVMGQPSNYPAHLPLNMASCSIFGEYSRAPKQQQKAQPSPAPPAPPGAADHPRCSARDTRMKRVMIHDNGMQPGDGRGFYRQGTPHPTRKRLSVNSELLDAHTCDDKRGTDVARANTRFNAAHSESEGSKYSEDTTMSDFHSESRSSDASASEDSLPLGSESHESLEFRVETPMSVDIPADMTMVQELFDGTKRKPDTKQEPPDSNRTRRKAGRVPKQRRRVNNNNTDYSMTDVEMHEASSIAPQDFIKPNLPPPMESPPTPTGQRSVRVSGRKRKAAPMQSATPTSASAAAANATPKRQRRAPGRPRAATPLVPDPPAEATSTGECGGGGAEEAAATAPEATPKAADGDSGEDAGGDGYGDGGGGALGEASALTEIAAM